MSRFIGTSVFLASQRMKRLAVILVALALSGPAHAVTITHDYGGFLNVYAQQRFAYYQSGEEVRIMGICASGCTLYLNLPNACIGRGVHLMFHAPRNANGDKSEAARKSTEESRLWMLAQYPQWVQDFINAAGGLSKRALWMGYPIASKHMRTCGKPRGKLVQTALPVPVGPKLVPTPRQKPLILQPKHDFSAAEGLRQAEVRDLYLREMNARELVRHLQRIAAWRLQDQRAKELAARQVVEDAQARIEELLHPKDAATLVILPTAVQEPAMQEPSLLHEQEGPRIRKKQNFNLAGHPRIKIRLR